MTAACLTASLADFGDAVWRATELVGSAAAATVSSGHPELDCQLPGGGWPVGALSEVLQAQSGQNEWRLLLPALRQMGQGPVALVGAPHVPFGPGLAAQGLEVQRLLWVSATTPAERLWAAEQALRCAQVVAVLAWLPQVRAEQLRRLQIAAHEYGKLLFVLRPAQAQSESSPAVLRLLVGSAPPGTMLRVDALQVQVLKRRGPPLMQTLILPARSARLGALLAVKENTVPSARILESHDAGGGDALDRLAAAA